MITEMEDPNAIYPSLFAAVVTIIKGHKTHSTRSGGNKKLVTAISMSCLLPLVETGVIRPHLEVKRHFITQHCYQ